MTDREKVIDRKMIELKPCPFCKGKAHFRGRQLHYFGQNYYGDRKIRYGVYVYCGSCKARGGLSAATVIFKGSVFTKEDKAWLEEEAARLWNERQECK